MKKKLAWFLLIWLFVPALAFPASAAQIIFEIDSILAERQKERLTDSAGLLSSVENEELLRKLDEISVRQACDVVIVTTNGLGGKTPTEFADDFFDYNGFGIGPDADGILLMISMEDRDWAISNDLYTLVKSRNKSGPTEGSAVYNDATDFIDADPLPEENEAVERKRYVFDHSEPATIAGDGSTVFRVYFKRLTYAFRMCAANSPGVTIPGPECENSSYHLYASAQYKYGQSTAPTFDKGLHDLKLKDYIWKLYQNGSNMYSEAPLQKAENMWA